MPPPRSPPPTPSAADAAPDATSCRLHDRLPRRHLRPTPPPTPPHADATIASADAAPDATSRRRHVPPTPAHADAPDSDCPDTICPDAICGRRRRPRRHVTPTPPSWLRPTPSATNATVPPSPRAGPDPMARGFTKTLSDLTKFTWPIGNLALLQYLFWEKVQPLDDEAFDPLAHEYPLMLNWSEDEAKKRDAYDTSYGRGNGTIDDVISEKYRQTLIAQQGRKAEEELEQELEQEGRAQKRKIIEMRVHRAGIIVVEKLEKKGLVFKPDKGSDDDIEFVEHSEYWVGKYGPSKYKSSKYWTDVKSTPAKEDMDNRVDASFTTGNGNKLAREKGVHHNTPGTGDEGDPFVIEDNGNSPNPSLATVDTNDFPAITSTPKNMNEVSDGSSADKSEEISMDSLNTRIKNAKENGTPENDGKENDGKRKRKQSKYCLSPYQQNGGRKRAKKSLFGIRAAMINTDYIKEDHIEAAKVYIRTLADSEKLCSKTVVHMTGIGGETCTPEILEAIISKKWLHGGVINSYCNHMQTHNPRADRHILSSWVSHWLILRADGNVNNSERHFMDHFTNQTKMVSRVTEEYFIKDKAYFPFHVEENHWITVLMHNKKKEFQVLNSTGKCSKRVLAKIAKLRAEIANDTKEVNALIETEHPDVSSWPIREYDMPSQTDGVSCGLFVVKCVQNWDGDDWTFEFDQDEVNASRGRILAEILFSECNTKEVVKEKILKIMEKK
ncbi:uncharacterized protein [Aegilops tauschii subsp. strangulata]|uniref:uncharacterized protein n=1 Tax=Aegilops tauschii subsp. strangulata TaxID=200361 RepID=UPI00098A4132